MENGHETLFKLPREWQERIEVIDLKDTKEYPIAIETVLKLIKGKPVEICNAHGKVSCMICKREERDTEASHSDLFVDLELNALEPDTIVIFDSLTQLTASAINNITKAQPDDYKMQTDDWGYLSKLIEVFAVTIQQARYNRVVISHEIEAETEGKKRTLVPVAGSRNSSRNISKAFDHVVYCERKNKKHVFSSSTTDATNILAGSRTDAVVGAGDKPSLLQIFKPELYSSAKPAPASTIKPANSQATDLLNRLKHKT